MVGFFFGIFCSLHASIPRLLHPVLRRQVRLCETEVIQWRTKSFHTHSNVPLTLSCTHAAFHFFLVFLLPPISSTHISSSAANNFILFSLSFHCSADETNTHTVNVSESIQSSEKKRAGGVSKDM